MSTKTPRSSSVKRLIIVRHAHRDKPLGGALDNGLSAKGKKQAKLVAEHFNERHGVEAKSGLAPLILSSPKARCVETVEPIAKALGLKVIRSEDLNEGGALERKCARFIAWWKKEAPELTVACSHGDWIPDFTRILTGNEIDLSKGGWIGIRLDGASVHVEEIIHDLSEM